MKLSVCIEMFWHDLPIDQRIRRVKALGFEAFEFWGWKNKDLDKIRAAQEETGLTLVAMGFEPSFSLVNRMDDQAMVDATVESAAAARSLGCARLIVTTGNVIADESFEITRRRVVRRLKRMAEVAEENGVTLLLEPANAVVDHPGYWLTKMPQSADIVQEVASAHVKIVDDLYHQQLSEGNLIGNLTLYAPWIGHFHAAGVPGRCELIGGEIDYRGIFSAIERTGYDGYIGLEFRAIGLKDDAALKQALTLL